MNWGTSKVEEGEKNFRVAHVSQSCIFCIISEKYDILSDLWMYSLKDVKTVGWLPHLEGTEGKTAEDKVLLEVVFANWADIVPIFKDGQIFHYLWWYCFMSECYSSHKSK